MSVEAAATGQPSEPYPLAADTLAQAEIAAAKQVLDGGRVTMGERVMDFERQFAEWVGAEHAIMVNSGSSANLLAIDVLLRTTAGAPRLLPGDEVLVPGLAWPTTVWPIAQLGLVPVFVDVDPVTLAIDLESARETLGPRTKAIFVIHPLGRAADLDALRTFSDENDMVLLEDCCESLGAHWSGRHVGTEGLLSTFSFYFSHHISTIEGGMVVTQDPRVADDVRSLRAHGWIRDRSDRSAWISRNPDLDPRFLFATTGYNVRPTEIQGAIGSVQLARLDSMLQAREELAATVRAWVNRAVPWIELIGSELLTLEGTADRRGRKHSWMTLPMRVGSDAPLTRNQVIEVLEQSGVETRPLMAGNLSRHPGVSQIRHRNASHLAACDALLRDSFMIGCHPIATEASLQTLEHAISALASS